MVCYSPAERSVTRCSFACLAATHMTACQKETKQKSDWLAACASACQQDMDSLETAESACVERYEGSLEVLLTQLTDLTSIIHSLQIDRLSHSQSDPLHATDLTLRMTGLQETEGESEDDLEEKVKEIFQSLP